MRKETEMVKDNEYGTTSIYQGAALLTTDFEYKRFDDDNFSGKVQFIFERSEALDRVVHDFVNGKLMVNCEKFISAWQRLRKAIDERGMRNGNGYGKFRR
jgi:hypothetical protein